MPADFKAVTLANKSGVFDVRLDNPRDARLFRRRFGVQPTSNVPARRVSRRSISSSIDHSRSDTPAAIAGVNATAGL